jgi:putative phosphoesterase
MLRAMVTSTCRVGVISDTHGLVRPEALAAFAGVDAIVHAGDVGKPDVLETLGAVAPTHAVRGNIDRGIWAEALPLTCAVELAGQVLYLVHELEHLDLDPAAADFAAVITGHSHQPCREERGGVLFLNPGSAGPRRFKLPVSLARLEVGAAGVAAEIIELPV